MADRNGVRVCYPRNLNYGKADNVLAIVIMGIIGFANAIIKEQL